jgi:hypothetical protein
VQHFQLSLRQVQFEAACGVRDGFRARYGLSAFSPLIFACKPRCQTVGYPVPQDDDAAVAAVALNAKSLESVSLRTSDA